MAQSWGSDTIYCEAVCDSDDIFYHGSDDEDYDDPEIRKRRYEAAGQRYLDGTDPFLLSASLKGPFDSARWSNPWRSKYRTIDYQQVSHTLPLDTMKQKRHMRRVSIPETIDVDTEDSLRCHLPSPESLKQASVIDSHPYLEEDELAKVQNWRDTVQPVTLTKDSFWASTPKANDSTRKRRARSSEWLRKLASKRRRTDLMESGSVDTPVHRRRRSTTSTADPLQDISTPRQISFSSVPTGLPSSMPSYFLNRQLSDVDIQMRDDETYDEPADSMTPSCNTSPRRLRSSTKKKSSSQRSPKIYPTKDGDEMISQAAKCAAATLSSPKSETRSSPRNSQAPSRHTAEKPLDHGEIPLESNSQEQTSLRSTDFSTVIADGSSSVRKRVQWAPERPIHRFETQNDQSFCFKMRPQDSHRDNTFDGLDEDEEIADDVLEKSSELSVAPSPPGLSSRSREETLRTTEHASAPSQELPPLKHPDAQQRESISNLPSRSPRDSVLSELSSLSSGHVRTSTRESSSAEAMELASGKDDLVNNVDAGLADQKNHPRSINGCSQSLKIEPKLFTVAQENTNVQDRFNCSVSPVANETASNIHSTQQLESQKAQSASSESTLQANSVMDGTQTQARASGDGIDSSAQPPLGVSQPFVGVDHFMKPILDQSCGKEGQSLNISKLQEQESEPSNNVSIGQDHASNEVGPDSSAFKDDVTQSQANLDQDATAHVLKVDDIVETSLIDRGAEAEESQVEGLTFAPKSVEVGQAESQGIPPSQQSPWAGPKPSCLLNVETTVFPGAAGASVSATTPQKVDKLSQPPAMVQTPWARDMKLRSETANTSFESSSHNFDAVTPMVSVEELRSSTTLTPSLPARQVTPEPQFSVKSFSFFMSPSPERSNQPRRATWRDSGSRLPNTQHILSSATRNPWNKGNAKRRVTWAPMPSEAIDIESSRLEQTSSTQHHGRQGSPPPQTPIAELPTSDDSKFNGHFKAVAKRTNVLRQRLLPTASQQISDSPATGAMAEKFLQADEVRPIPNDECNDNNELGHEPQDDIDVVEDVFREMSDFLEVWDVDEELEQARRDDAGSASRLNSALQSPW